MDSITQLQNYLSSITTFMTHSLQHATHGSASVSDEQLQEALKLEHQHYRELSAQAAAAQTQSQAATQNQAGLSSTAVASPSDTTNAAAASSSSNNGIPDLSAPLYSGLSSSVEFAMSDRASQLFKRVLEADALLASLPSELGEEAQARQIDQLAYLQGYNEHAGRELQEAQERAKLWQQRVSFVLQQAAAAQLRSYTNQTTNSSTMGTL